MLNQMIYSPRNNAGLDITDSLRGKISTIDDILNFRKFFEDLDKAEEGLKEGAKS